MAVTSKSSDNSRSPTAPHGHGSWKAFLPIAIIALVMGLLIGLSKSEVIAPVIIALLGAVLGIFSLIRKERHGGDSVSYLLGLWQLAVFSFVLLVGAFLGAQERDVGYITKTPTVLFSDPLTADLCREDLGRTDFNQAIREHGDEKFVAMMKAVNEARNGATYSDLKAAVRLACATFGVKK